MYRKNQLLDAVKSNVSTFIKEPAILFFFFIVAVSCEFQPSEIPLTKVEPPNENSPILFIEVQPDMDTLKLAMDTWAEFKFSSPQTDVRRVRIAFDDNVVYDFEYNSQNKPRFHIALGDYTEGLHHFTIQAFTSSNTGSIGDKVGAEGYLYEVRWPVIIHHNVNRWLHIKSAEFKNSGVLVRWEKYDYSDFEYYRFLKTSSIFENQAQFIIKNPRLPAFFDNTYLEGEYAEYQVGVNGDYGHSFTFEKPIEAPDITLNEENLFTVCWNRTRNPAMLGYYHVTLRIPNSTLHEFITKQGVQDTTAVYDISPGFGNNYEFQVRYVPKDFEHSYVNYNSSGGIAVFSLGNKMKAFENAIKLGDTDYLLMYGNSVFYKYNLATHSIVDSFRVTDLTNPGFIRVSPNGQFFSYFTRTDFVMRKSSGWGLVNQFPTPIINYGTPGFWSISISDNYRLVVVQHSNILTVTDVRSGDELFRKVGIQGEYFRDAVVNSAGDKILFENLVYENGKNYLSLIQLKENGFIELGETTSATPGANYGIVQYAIQNDKVLMLKNISSYDYRWEERNANDFSLITSFDLPDSFVPVAIDFHKKQLVARYGLHGGFDDSYSMFYDFENGASSKITPIIWGQKFALSNDILVNGSGRYLQVYDLILK